MGKTKFKDQWELEFNRARKALGAAHDSYRKAHWFSSQRARERRRRNRAMARYQALLEYQNKALLLNRMFF